MSIVKNIKGIDDSTWVQFKSLAARNNMKAANMFKVLIQEYEKKESSFWKEILNHKPVLSKKQYDEFDKRLSDVRKESGWRV